MTERDDRPKRRGPSPLFERAQRQREADHAGKPARLADLGRGIGALIPTEPPRPEPIPALSVVPGRMKSFEIDAYLDEPSPASQIVAELQAKLAAEDARMRRMLPEAPPGMEWRGELQSAQHLDFMRMHGDVTMRIVYRLFDTRTGEDVFERWAKLALAE